MRFRPIYDEREHFLILQQLGILDDLEDWEMFQEQERRFYEIDLEISFHTWQQCVKIE